MATLDDVRRLALALPGTDERVGRDGVASWRVRRTGFVWERPLRRGDLAALGPSAPQGVVLGARVADLGAKECLLQDDPSVFFTTPHFDGYPAVLVRLDEISPPELEEVVVEAWLALAPTRVAASFLAQR